MKKTLMFIVAVFAIFFSVTMFYASAESTYRSYCDSNNDGISDFCYEGILNETDGTICFTELDFYTNSIVIPQTVSVYDYDAQKNVNYTVTGINISPDEFFEDYCENCTVEIPDTVTYIDEKGFGYYTNYDGDITKSDTLKIICTENSAAQSYAFNNGFSFQCLKNIIGAKITFDKSVYTFTGSKIQPKITVSHSSKALTINKDYTVTYTNNINAGTATLVVTGIGDYYGSIKQDFKIYPLNASKATVTVKPAYCYTGSQIKPSVSITLSGKKLVKDKDYKLSYASNIEPGTAYITITYCKNYTSAKKVSFKIILHYITSFNVSNQTSSSLKLTWTKVACDFYYLYRYDPTVKKFVGIKKLTTNSYTDSHLSQIAHYYYRVRAVKVLSNKKLALSNVASVNSFTKLSTPKIKLATSNKAATIFWSKNTKASGYQIYRCDWYTDFKRIKTIAKNSTLSYKNSSLINDQSYYYKVRSYRTIDGVNYYSDFSLTRCTTDATSILSAATLSPHKSFKVYNRQGKTTTSYTYTLSAADLKILKKFKTDHFSSGMSREDVLRITLNWINRNVKYATGSSWNKIVNKSWVDAVFTYKLGQCAQYNGAMASMMSYLGFDCCVVQGYRGTWPDNYWQHFWCEVNIGARSYVMETGNYDSSGSWSYFLAPYSQTYGYIRNRKNMG